MSLNRISLKTASIIKEIVKLFLHVAKCHTIADFAMIIDLNQEKGAKYNKWREKKFLKYCVKIAKRFSNLATNV